MSSSLNKATIIGKLGKDPEFRSFGNGGRVCSFSVATSEKWKDKASGENKEKTEWHKISIFNEYINKYIENFHVGKGDMVYLEGQIETRKYEKEGRDVYTTEILIKQFDGEFKLLAASKKEKAESQPETHKGFDSQGNGPSNNDMDAEIPF